MQLRASIVAIGWLWATTASADLLGPGEKGVKLSIQVDGTVPAGKALILVNTFRGADLITPNTVSKVEWHPMGGEMQLRLLASAEADKIPALREKLDRDGIKPISDKGKACGAAFRGVRTISDTNPAEEVRWTFTATITGDDCKAELVRTDYLDGAGKPVAAPGNTDIPPPSPPGIQPAPAKAEPAKVETPAATPAKTDTPRTESGCSIAAPAPAGLVVLFALLLRRRRR